MTRKSALFGTFTLLVLMVAVNVQADTINITTDRLFENSSSAMLDLDGSTFIANGSAPADLSMLPATLSVGEQVNLSHTFNTTFSRPFEWSNPHALVDGTTYDDVNLQASNFRFSSSAFSLMPGDSSAPFTFTGTLNGYSAMQPTNLLFTADLTGYGMANINTTATGNGMLALNTVSYNFEPTPEPEPLVLLALGMVGLAVSWRLRHAHSGS